MKFEHFKLRFDKILTEAKTSKQYNKLVQAVSDIKGDCDRDNIWVHNAADRLTEFKKYVVEETKRLEAEVERTKNDHIDIQKAYAYAKEQMELVLVKPKPKMIPPPQPAALVKSTKKKVLKTIEVDEDEIPPVPLK